MKTREILRALGGATLACFSAGAAIGQTCTGDPNVCGWWSDNFPLKINSQSPPNKQMQAIHTLLLPNGKILCIDGYNTDPSTGTDTHAVLIDPNLFLDPNNEPNAIKLVSADHEFTDHLPSQEGHMLFCSGHARLPDGRIVFRGGNHDNPGNFRTTLYDPNATHSSYGAVGQFIQGPDEYWLMDPNDSNSGEHTLRWYPTLTTLHDGRILILDGWSPTGGPQGNGNVPVILQPGSGSPTTWTWSPLYQAEYESGGAPWSFSLTFYGVVYQLSNGLVFRAGSHYDNMGNDPNLPECEEPNSLNPTVDPNNWMSRTLSLAQEQWVNTSAADIKTGSACMFRKDKIMKAGGGVTGHQYAACQATCATDKAYVIDPTVLTPNWQQIASMPRPRIHFYLVPLPDGQVLAIGGAAPQGGESEACNNDYPVLAPDLYDPDDDSWTTLAEMATPRLYHSPCVLVPSGAIFIAGGQAEGVSSALQRTYQVFKPPYFFQGTRPVITSVGASWAYNHGYNVGVGDNEANAITKVRLIRLGSATHSHDQDTRCIELQFSVLSSSTIRVTAPLDGSVAPPGHYMLFICKDLQTASANTGRLPSEGRIIRIGPLSSL